MTSDLSLTHTYQPFEKQKLAHQSRARYLLFGGAVGPGKSRWLCEHIFARMIRWPGIEILLGRYNLIDLQRTTEKVWTNVIDERFWSPQFGGRHDRQKHMYVFANGSTLYLTGLKDWESWMSANLGMIAIDECQEVAETVIENLDTRLRWSSGQGSCQRPECAALPNAREHSEHPLYQIAMCCNPTPAWPKQRFYDRNLAGTLPKSHDFVQALTEDNPYLPPDYEHALMENHNPNWVRRMLKGDWSAFEGATFTQFSRPTHMWHDVDVGDGHSGPIPEFTEVVGGIDWGATTTYAHKTAATLTGRMRNGNLLTFWEYAKQGPASTDFFEKIRNITRIWKVSMWHADASQPRAIEALRESGLPMKPADRNQGSRKDGIALMVRLFEVGPGGPKHFIHERCTNVLTGIEVYHEIPETDVIAGHGPIPTDPVRRDDDEVDALRYNVVGMNKSEPIVTNVNLEIVHGNISNAHVSRVIQQRRELKHKRLEELLQKTGGREF